MISVYLKFELLRKGNPERK